MQLIPHDDLKSGQNFNFTPMIDFLFLMLSLFATLAISRAKLFDSEVSLVTIDPRDKTSKHASEIQVVDLSISADGSYKWLTEYDEYPMENLTAVQQEISRQYDSGAIQSDKGKVEVRLHIDQRVSWKIVAESIFAIRELGFTTHPVYENQAQ